jgi:hypothetical protein
LEQPHVRFLFFKMFLTELQLHSFMIQEQVR